MSKTVFETLCELEVASTVSSKRQITKKLVNELSQNKDFSSVFFRTLYSNIFRHNNDLDCKKVIHLTVDALPHVNNKGVFSIAIFVAFIQDHENSDSELDTKILKILVDETKARNLNYIVNDISVNSYQWVENKVVHRVLRG